MTYKTALRMFRQLRSLLSQDGTLLVGTVEMDEGYFGGKEKWRHASKRGTKRGRGSAGKTPVFGMAQRAMPSIGMPSKIVAEVMPDVTERSLLPHVVTRVLPASTVYTDEFGVYNGLDHAGYRHSRVAHSQKVYVAGDVHTNTIKGFWSLVKRGIGGVYHSVSTQHLQSYLDEYVYRYNHRDDEAPMFDAVRREVPTVRYGQFGRYHPLG